MKFPLCDESQVCHFNAVNICFHLESHFICGTQAFFTSKIPSVGLPAVTLGTLSHLGATGTVSFPHAALVSHPVVNKPIPTPSPKPSTPISLISSSHGCHSASPSHRPHPLLSSLSPFPLVVKSQRPMNSTFSNILRLATTPRCRVVV